MGGEKEEKKDRRWERWMMEEDVRVWEGKCRREKENEIVKNSIKIKEGKVKKREKNKNR